jgi:hypothetical protein
VKRKPNHIVPKESTPQKLTPEASREGKKSRKRQDTNQADHGRELLKKEKRYLAD